MTQSVVPHRPFRVFCDFDGTIVRQDVGDAFFETFCGSRMWDDHALFLAGEISAQETFRRHFQQIASLDDASIDAFCAGFAVDPGFAGFLDLMREHEIPVTILSDGLDIYITRIFGKLADRVEIFTNHVDITRRPPEMRFAWSDEECPRCGTCKRNLMLTRAADDDILVYIGDGFSDFCPVQYADVVFACGKLIRHCQEHNISFHAFSTFDEISGQMKKLLAKRIIRKPRRAELLRKAVWMQG